eukprot:2135695-Pleurochrysis_carterae.AAC.1
MQTMHSRFLASSTRRAFDHVARLSERAAEPRAQRERRTQTGETALIGAKHDVQRCAHAVCGTRYATNEVQRDVHSRHANTMCCARRTCEKRAAKVNVRAWRNGARGWVSWGGEVEEAGETRESRKKRARGRDPQGRK